MRSKKSVGDAGAGAECIAGAISSLGMRNDSGVEVSPRRSASGTAMAEGINESSTSLDSGLELVSTGGVLGAKERRASEEALLEDKDGR